MSSSYSSLLSPSRAHADDHRVLLGGDADDDDDMAAVSSYLSLDDIVDDVAGGEWYRPLAEESAAAAELQQEPLLFDTLQAEDGYCVSGSGGEQSSAALANDNHDRIDLTQ